MFSFVFQDLNAAHWTEIERGNFAIVAGIIGIFFSVMIICALEEKK
jgi:hypothetical protein